MLGPRFCARAFSSCGERGPLFIAVRGPLTITASPAAEHRLQTRRLNNCGSRAQLLRGMWDPPRPGLEPVSPALAGGLSTTAPPGKPQLGFIICIFWMGKLRLKKVKLTGGSHSLVVEPGWLTPCLKVGAPLLHTAASQRLPAWLCPGRKVLRERGFSVKTVPEELNVSCGSNSQDTRKNILSIINTRKKQEIWFWYIAAKMRTGKTPQGAQRFVGFENGRP